MNKFKGLNKLLAYNFILILSIHYKLQGILQLAADIICNKSFFSLYAKYTSRKLYIQFNYKYM